jgi:hypothetical protein
LLVKTATSLNILIPLGTFLAMAAPVAAANVVALAGDRDLVWVDTETMAVSGMATAMGAEGRLLGIDVRPADGQLYGVFEDGTIATLDPTTGAATAVSMLATMLPAGVSATIDFNPVADKLRVMGSDGTSLRVNVETGEVVEDGSHAYGDDTVMPDVIAGAYTNSHAGTDTTQLFDIDGKSGWLVLQDPPNDGMLNPVGETGLAVEWVGFDIASDGMGGNEAWLMSAGKLYSVDLATGMASEAGTIDGAGPDIRDIAITPAM